MLFEEHPHMKNTHWLTDVPVSSCRKHKVGSTQVLCSGSTMGSREGILEYIDIMIEEFDYWKTRSECRLNMRGDVSIKYEYHHYFTSRSVMLHCLSIPILGPIYSQLFVLDRSFEKCCNNTSSYWPNTCSRLSSCTH